MLPADPRVFGHMPFKWLLTSIIACQDPRVVGNPPCFGLSVNTRIYHMPTLGAVMCLSTKQKGDVRVNSIPRHGVAYILALLPIIRGIVISSTTLSQNGCHVHLTFGLMRLHLAPPVIFLIDPLIYSVIH